MNDVKEFVKALFSRRWWWVTLLVLLVMALLARLGVWQLDRLAERRAANAELTTVLESGPLDLTDLSMDEALDAVENQTVIATGRFDFEEQIILKVQNWQGRAGVHLITPLVFADGATAVLVDRGWVPDAENNPAAIAKYNVPAGKVNVDGYAARSQIISRRGTIVPAEPQTEWYRVDIAAIAPQMPYELLPIYVLQAQDGDNALPYRDIYDIDLSEGSHLSNALQWFIFCIGLGIGYLAYVHTMRKRERGR